MVDTLHEQGITATQDHLVRSTLPELVKQVWAAQCASCEVAMQEEADDEESHAVTTVCGLREEAAEPCCLLMKPLD